jgi:hypothetical protein
MKNISRWVWVLVFCLTIVAHGQINLTNYDVRFLLSNPKTAEYWLGLKPKLSATEDAEIFFGKAGSLQTLGMATHWRSDRRGGGTTYSLTDGTVITLPGFHESRLGATHQVAGPRGVATLNDQTLDQALIEKLTGSKPFEEGPPLFPVARISEPGRKPYYLVSIESTGDMLLLLQSTTLSDDLVGYIGVVGAMQPLGAARYEAAARRGQAHSYSFADGSKLTLPGFHNPGSPITFTSVAAGKTTASDLGLVPAILKQLMAEGSEGCEVPVN